MAKQLNIDIVRSWNELNQKEFEAITLLLFSAEPSLQRDIEILRILVKEKGKPLTTYRFRYLLSEVPHSEWKKWLDFLVQNNRTAFVPVIKIGEKYYYGPMDRIQNLSADEFAVADDLHIRYRESKNKEFLQYLFHVLYQEQEERPVFDKLKLPKQINKEIPMETLMITEITYFGCKNYIADKYKKVFPKSNKKTSTSRTGFGKVIQQMAKGDLSKLAIIEQVNIYKFLSQFQDDIEMIQKAKSK